MSRLKKSFKNGLMASLAVAVVLGAAACSVDSPTAPDQVASDPPSSGANLWRIAVNVSPSELEVGGNVPATVKVSVESKTDGSRPANGTTLTLSTTLGEFDVQGSGMQTTGATIQGGKASALLFPGDVAAGGTVTVRLQGSQGRDEFRVASAGEPFITAISPNSGPESGGTRVTIEGINFGDVIRVGFTTNGVTKLGTVLSSSPTLVTVEAPTAGKMTENACDFDLDGEADDGVRTAVTPADINVEYATQSGSTKSGNIAGAFSYIPADDTCRDANAQSQ